MRVSGALRKSEEQFGAPVIRTPSTLGKVGGSSQASRASEILCDWFQGTLPLSIRDAVLQRLTATFGVPRLGVDIPSAMRCYRECLEFPNGSRLYQSNRYGETCCIVLSGAANPSCHFPLIRQLVKAGVRTTRFDLAFDDRRGQVSIDDVCNQLHSGTAISRWKNATANETLSLPSGGRRGRKVQFGSKTSDAYLVTYDKGLETETAEEGKWVRWELRLSDEQANQFVTEFLADHPDASDGDLRKHVAKAKNQSALLCHDAADYAVLDTDIAPELVGRFKRLALAALKSRLSFRDRTTALNISRAAVLPWWESFLEYFDPDAEVVDVGSDPDVGLSDDERFALNMASIPDWPDADDERVIKKRQSERRKRQAYEKAGELLTEIFEEHIRPAMPEWLGDIPDYRESEQRSWQEEADDLLVYVGLVPETGARIFQFPRMSVAKTKATGMTKTKGMNVISFPISRRAN